MKLQVDEYEYLISELETLHKESVEFVEEYMKELDSILVSEGGFQTDLISEKIKMLLEMFQHQLFPELVDLFENTETELKLLGESVSEADESGRMDVQWEE